VQYSHPGANGVNTWRWSLDENITSTQQNPLAQYKIFNNKTVKLTVGNGFCTDSSSQTVELKNYLKADFTVFEDNCPNEPIAFTSNAVGQVISHRWAFGDGGTAVVADPTHIYAAPNRQTPFTVQYTVTDRFGCTNTATKPVLIYTSCFLAVPTAFTPNGDGLNDFLKPLNAIKAEKVEFAVYSRWGQLMYKTSDWKQGWNGTFKGSLQGSGTYIWTLKYINRDTKQTVNLKGTAVLIR
jgi:gliding motility-associated-like protein